jgi:CheD.
MFPQLRRLPKQDVASLNIRAALALAEHYHLHLTAQDMGSTGYRTIMFDLWNGNVWVRHQPMGTIQQDAYQKNQCAVGR